MRVQTATLACVRVCARRQLRYYQAGSLHRRGSEEGAQRRGITMEDGIVTKLTEVFRDVFADDSLVLSRKVTAMDIKGWDSLAHITLMLSVQRAFHIRLSALETSQLQNVGALIDLLHAKGR
jgi:acyl carrier protein